MARRVEERPFLPSAVPRTFGGIITFTETLVRQLVSLFGQYGYRLNAVLPKDGSEPMTKPLPLHSSTVANLPDAAEWEGSLVYVSDETGGAVPAFSNGTNWLRCTDRAIVS